MYADSDLLINKELFKINEWLVINKLSLNIAKSKCVVFHMHRKHIEAHAPKINNIIIEKVNEFNFLGLTLDTHLNWKKHSEHISNRCVRIIGILNRLKQELPLRIKIMLYNTLLVPQINYCLTIWGFQCERINKLQNYTKYNFINKYKNSCVIVNCYINMHAQLKIILKILIVRYMDIVHTCRTHTHTHTHTML